jgi:hypothetical protein
MVNVINRLVCSYFKGPFTKLQYILLMLSDYLSSKVITLSNFHSLYLQVAQLTLLYNKRACPQTMFKILRLRRQRCQINEDNRVAKNMGEREIEK